jgi:signal transduction histidine kinase
LQPLHSRTSADPVALGRFTRGSDPGGVLVVPAPARSPEGWLDRIDALRRTNTDLETAVANLTRLGAAQLREIERLAAADRRKDEFLAVLGHELRNPLAPIRTAAEILSRPGVSSAAAGTAQLVVERQLGHMVRLIDDLADMARIVQGKIDLRCVATDLGDVLRRSLEVVDHDASTRRQPVSVSLPSAPIAVLGDATRLVQAFGNVLRNASKFSRSGGRIWLTAETRAATGGGREAVVRVRDEGLGIAPDLLPSVFDLFKQHGVSPHDASGLGVGLALVQRIVNLHGGRVTARSAGLDRGSEFTITLPLIDSVS